jgi:uncharacterized protein with PIN domain
MVFLMKFIADVMLGRLAKRMRLLGFDVLYDRTLDDNAIIRLSLEQDRVILTRDTALAERPLAVNHVFITYNDVRAQMQQVLAAFPGEILPQPLTRCSECNEPLAAISRKKIKDLVPLYVYEKHETFLHCMICKRVYWTGTHVGRMGLAKSNKKKPGSSNRSGPS